MIKNDRDGQTAGEKDVKVVGPVKKKIVTVPLPSFKPEDCGHFYGYRRTKE